jgi:hypothetical protein
MAINFRSLSVFVSSLLFLLQTQGFAQETSAAAAEPRTSGQIVASPQQAVPVLPVPRVLKFGGAAKDAGGNPLQGIVGITFSIYAEQQGGTPLWMETQNIALDTYGRYAALLGSTQSAGIPLDLFAAGEPRWLGVKVELPEESEQTRVLLVSVPYALKASDADTLGGRPASAYMLAPGEASSVEPSAGNPSQTTSASRATAKTTAAAITGSGTANYIPIFQDNAGTLGNSTLFQNSSGNLGIGYTSPTSARLVIAAPVGGGVLNSSNLADQDMFVTLTAPGATDKHAYFGPSTATNLTLGVGLTEMMRIANSGNVGIGSSNPVSARLVIGAPKGGSVLNSSNLTDQDMFVTLTAPGATDKHAYFGPSTPTNLTLGVGLTEMMRITNAGRVGIGTSTPATTLDVNGTINALSFSSSGAQGASFGGPISGTSSTSSGTAVFGSGTSGAYGVGGNSATSFGVYGDSLAPEPGAAGVFGFTLGTYSTTYTSEAGIAYSGLWGDAANGSASGVGVAIFGTADSNYAGAFINNSPDFPALFANNNSGTGIEASASSGYGVSGSTFSGTGVYGSTSSGGNGVEGISSSLTEQEAGVLGVGNTTSVLGESYNIYSGVWGDTGTSSTSVAPAWAIGVLGTADDSHAGVFLNNSSGWSTMYIQNYGTGGTGAAMPGLFSTLNASTRTGTCGIGGNGDLTCTGQVKTLTTTAGARMVETYAMHSPENWMEDFGSGALQKGVAVVNIDPAFAETVSQTSDYHVFMTPNGDSKGLYVIHKTAGSFEVHESGGGTSSLSFDYRIVAKRRGYESQRLTDVTERFRAEQKALNPHIGVPVKPAVEPRPTPLTPKVNSKFLRRTAAGIPQGAVTRPAPLTHP